ncbi:GNAT family N-acetyltransferase [Catenulispora yoronensis]
MTIDIRELDPAQPETLAALLPVFQAALAVDAPLHARPDTAFMRLVTAARVDQHRVFLAAYDDGAPIGYGCLIHNLIVNQDMVFADIWVLPERRADVAAPLIEAFKEYARGRGATRFVGGSTEPAAAGYDPVFTAGGAAKSTRTSVPNWT